MTEQGFIYYWLKLTSESQQYSNPILSFQEILPSFIGDHLYFLNIFLNCQVLLSESRPTQGRQEGIIEGLSSVSLVA